MTAPVSSQPSNRSLLQPNNSNSSSSATADHGTSHRISPQDAALRGASLAFQKQKLQQEKDPDNTIQRRPSLTPSQLSRHTTGGTGGISRQTTGSSSVLVDATERERERQALFLSSDSGRSSLSSPALGLAGGNSKATDSKSASFIAATLAASRSASPGTGVVGSGPGPGFSGGENGGTRTLKASPLRQPVDASSRRGSVANRSARSSVESLTMDTTSLPPATSLISMFENKREPAPDPVKRRTEQPTGKKPRRSSMLDADPPVDPLDLNMGRSQPRDKHQPRSPLSEGRPTSEGETSPMSNEKPKPRPKPGKKPKAIITQRPVTPPPPMVSRANTEIVSPKPRKPDIPPRLEVTTPSNFQDGFSVVPTNKVKPNPPPSKPDRGKDVLVSPNNPEDQAVVQKSPEPPATTAAKQTRARPKAPRKRNDLSGQLPASSKTPGLRRRSLIASSDGQDESKVTTPEDELDIRPSTADSRSSNDSFVSASSAPTRDETDSIRTIEPPSSTSTTPRLRPIHMLSTQPSTMSLPIRRTATGSSQLPIESLSDAIMAGSLASARHTPVSVASNRTPPPLPPSRRKGVAKHKTGSRKSSPHRMRQTMRQPASKSDDEDARRPHHKKGLNNKKHAHHEGSRSRWREEITEREKKRYEAVWASNRGLFLIESLQQSINRRLLVRNESYEAASEHVANVVVRDIWSRSRLPEAELAEVWDLVYGHGPRGPLVYAALSKQEFVVGMWLVDQRLRGRKIPPRVSESVWDSAKGLRVLNPGIGGGHGHSHGHKGHGAQR